MYYYKCVSTDIKCSVKARVPVPHEVLLQLIEGTWKYWGVAQLI